MPSIFFLDGHWSGEDTGRGYKDCPLYEELSCIMKFFEPTCIIIIDDVRLFGKGLRIGDEICDWEDINVGCILNLMKSRIEKHYFLPSHLDPSD